MDGHWISVKPAFWLVLSIALIRTNRTLILANLARSNFSSGFGELIGSVIQKTGFQVCSEDNSSQIYLSHERGVIQ